MIKKKLETDMDLNVKTELYAPKDNEKIQKDVQNIKLRLEV